MRASFNGLRHLGQVSFINRSKDMARPFLGSVADVLARTRRTICKNPRNAALALRRFHYCFGTPSPLCGERRLELRRQTCLALFSRDYASGLYFRLSSAALCWHRNLSPYTVIF
jgi:hypothetical protein